MIVTSDALSDSKNQMITIEAVNTQVVIIRTHIEEAKKEEIMIVETEGQIADIDTIAEDMIMMTAIVEGIEGILVQVLVHLQAVVVEVEIAGDPQEAAAKAIADTTTRKHHHPKNSTNIQNRICYKNLNIMSQISSRKALINLSLWSHINRHNNFNNKILHSNRRKHPTKVTLIRLSNTNSTISKAMLQLGHRCISISSTCSSNKCNILINNGINNILMNHNILSNLMLKIWDC